MAVSLRILDSVAFLTKFINYLFSKPATHEFSFHGNEIHPAGCSSLCNVDHIVVLQLTPAQVLVRELLYCDRERKGTRD